jgi:hypothetical protein
MTYATPFIDAEINQMVDRYVSSLLSGNRYSDWSPNLSSRLPAGSKWATIKFNLYAALLRRLSALQAKIAELNEGVASTAGECEQGLSANTPPVAGGTAPAAER